MTEARANAAEAVRTANLRGAVLMMVTMAAFTLNDTSVKALGESLPLAEILLLRGIVSSVLLFGVVLYSRPVRIDLPAREWILIALRSFADLAATFFFLTALLHMPLANINAIMQALPLTVTLAAALVFGERLGWRRMLAILVGFGGVLLIIRPGAAGFNAWALWALAAVACVTLRDLAARRLAPTTPSAIAALAAAVLVTLAAGVAAAQQGWQPVTPGSALLASIAGLFIVAGYLAAVATMRVGDVGFVSPFRYTGLVWALILGFAVFGDWPDRLTLAGAGIVVATGVFTLYRERRLAREGAAKTVSDKA